MNPTIPKVSLILPAYNHLGYLPLAVETALRQTVDNFELIIVNDGSTDGTREWLDALRDLRVRVIHQDNRGPAEAINAGIRASRGEYLTWISADNWCAPYFVEALAAALDADPSCVMAYSPFYMIDAGDRIVGIRFDNLLLLRELVTNRPRGLAGFMYRKSMHDTLGLYEGWALDTLMWARMMEEHSAVFVLEPTYYYRFHDERATVTQAPRVTEAVAKITSGFLARHPDPGADATLARLYPGLAKVPQLATQARADFAGLLAQCGNSRAALDLIAATLRSAGADELLRPLVNAVALCRLTGEEPAGFVAAALAGNATLPVASAEAAVDVVDALAVMSGGGRADLLRLEQGSLLTALERPKVFSYTAWKHDPSRVPVRGA